MTLICAQINHKDPNFIMETQLIDDTSFLYEWKTAEEDLEFLDYTYCFEVDNPNKRKPSKSATSTTISLPEISGGNEKQAVLNLSVHKLQLIDDPESCLRRTVLISNTIKRLRNRTNSELNRILPKDKETASCFTCTLPCKRPRLHVTDLLNSNTDNLKGDYDQGLITKQDCTGRRETLTQKPNPAGNSLVCHVPLTHTTADDAKRNCDPVRFNGLDFSNVICALET